MITSNMDTDIIIKAVAFFWGIFRDAQSIICIFKVEEEEASPFAQ